MFKFDWVSWAKVAGIILLILTWSGLANLYSDNSSTQRYSYAEQQCAKKKLEQGKFVWPIVGKKKQAPSTNQHSNQTHYPKKDDTDWCDLAAQESMAKSTVGMERAAWATVRLTVLGILLLAGTLWFTKRAADSAAATALAATHAVEVAVNIEKPDLRIVKIETNPLDSGELEVVKLVCQNIGRMTAVLMGHSAFFEDAIEPLIQRNPTDYFLQMDESVVIPNQSTTTILAISLNSLNINIARDVKIYLRGAYSYESSMGKVVTHHFCYIGFRKPLFEVFFKSPPALNWQRYGGDELNYISE